MSGLRLNLLKIDFMVFDVALAEHSVCLARSSLAIHKHSTIDAVKSTEHNLRARLLVDLIVFLILVVAAI